MMSKTRFQTNIYFFKNNFVVSRLKTNRSLFSMLLMSDLIFNETFHKHDLRSYLKKSIDISFEGF